MAVNYPARDKFDIRRMDTLQVVREKCDAAAKRKSGVVVDDVGGGGNNVVEGGDVDKSASTPDNRGADSSNNEEEEGCVCIHLPVMKVNDKQQHNANKNDNTGEQTSTTTHEEEHNNDNDDDDDDNNNTIQAYNTEYNQPTNIQHQMYLSERNVMRFPYEGKANLNRYRLASSRIFGLIDDLLCDLLCLSGKGDGSENSGGASENGGKSSSGGSEDKSSSSTTTKSGYIFERASIDELFIDVTEFCYDVLDRERRRRRRKDDDEGLNSTNTNRSDVNDNSTKNDDGERVDEDENDATEEEEANGNNGNNKRVEFQRSCVAKSISSLKESVICHQNHIHLNDDDDDDDTMALRIGCHIASTVRQTVFETIGFTSSAGISTSKLVAKLAASYGKPNGQAVIYPDAIPYVMDETVIKKARMLGGKLGKKVVSLLPPDAATLTGKEKATLGCVAKLLSLDDLVLGLGEENGRWVYDACRGIEYEEVRSTLKVLPKSITAYKSFPKVCYPELEKWTSLLARDVMKRVQLDNARNHHIPRAITVGYTMKPGGSWIGKTFRLPFPNDKEFESRVQRLVDGTRNVLMERGEKSFIRIGFSAIDFVVWPKTGIDSFFSAAAQTTKSSTASPKRTVGVGGDGAVNGTPNNNVESTRARLDARRKQDSQKEESGLQSWLTKSDNREKSTMAAVETSSPTTGATNLKQSPQRSNGPDIAVDDGRDTIIGPNIAEDKETNQKIVSDEELARRLQCAYDDEARENNIDNNRNSDEAETLDNDDEVDRDRRLALQLQSVTDTTNSDMDRDRAMAMQLQSTYDREHSILSDVERLSGITKRKKGSTSPRSQRSSNKKNRIDNFFSKR